MPYEKKLWQDRIKDAQGNIIQEGTPFSAGNMNRIEQGIYDAHQMLEKQSQQSATIGHGLNVINSSQNSPLDIRIEGRTLVNVSQNVLDPAKYYVLSDKKSKVKFGDGTTYTGVAKFQGRAEKPILIRVSNFENKVSGSTLENPHLFKRSGTLTSGDTSLLSPSSPNFAEQTASGYSNIRSLDSTTISNFCNNNGGIMQYLFSFSLIEEIERYVGKIPASDTAGKVAWLKNNIAKLTFNWWGYGQSPAGYKANLCRWSVLGSTWDVVSTNTASTPTKTTITLTNTAYIDPNGFVHFLAYAEPSDGVTASTIYTDYVELETELNQNAQLWNPRFPLYEVDATTEYPNILTTWDENEVMRRFPMVESVQHVQNPYVIAEGENLLPPFTEGWTLNTGAVIKTPYELELNASDTSPFNTFQATVLPNTTYTVSIGSISANGRFAVREVKKDGSKVFKTNITSGNLSYTFTTAADTVKIEVDCTVQTPGLISYKNPMLTLSSTAKPFVPRNPSMLFAEVKLGALSDKKDILFKDGQDWKVTKWIEKDVVLDGKLAWSFTTDYTGYKKFTINNFTPSNYALGGFNKIATKFSGQILKQVASASNPDEYSFNVTTGALIFIISDTDTGFGETYTPTADEIKAYFNGWQAKTVDANGKPTAWRSLVDGTDAPTQTLAYVKDNMAPGFTPYKLSYVLATPQTIVVTDKVEGDLVINGATQIEVGSGVIIREKVTPVLNNGNVYYGLNIKDSPNYPNGSATKNRLAKIMNIYKNSIDNTKSWNIATGGGNGNYYAFIPKEQFDPTAEYTVTYLVLDRHLFTNNILAVTATYDSSLKSVVDSVVAKQSDIAATVSVNVRAIAELYKRVKALGG
jgi:hypothetical protein